MDTRHFPGREVPPYGEYVSADSLVVGRIYYRLVFLDDDMTIPEMLPFVFVGHNLHHGDENDLYFQDAESYLAGVRFDESAPDHSDVDAEFHRVSLETPFVYEFEKALDRLLYLSLERQVG